MMCKKLGNPAKAQIITDWMVYTGIGLMFLSGVGFILWASLEAFIFVMEMILRVVEK